MIDWRGVNGCLCGLLLLCFTIILFTPAPEPPQETNWVDPCEDIWVLYFDMYRMRLDTWHDECLSQCIREGCKCL